MRRRGESSNYQAQHGRQQQQWKSHLEIQSWLFCLNRVTHGQSRIRWGNSESKSRMCTDPPPDPQWFPVAHGHVRRDLLLPLVCTCVLQNGRYQVASVAKLGQPARAPVTLQRTFYAVVGDPADFIISLEIFPWAPVSIHLFIHSKRLFLTQLQT